MAIVVVIIFIMKVITVTIRIRSMIITIAIVTTMVALALLAIATSTVAVLVTNLQQRSFEIVLLLGFHIFSVASTQERFRSHHLPSVTILKDDHYPLRQAASPE